MLKSDEIKYIGEQIKKLISNIEDVHFNWIMRDHEPRWEEEYPGWTKESLIIR